MKNNKIVIIVLFVILLIIILEIFMYIKHGIELSNLNNMYKDIEILEDKIDIYYLNNKKLPIDTNLVKEFNCSINPNDNEVYYEIELEKLDNINLTYGKRKQNDKDIYIINEQSHTIYYYSGIEYENKRYFTIEQNYINVDLNLYQ